MGQTVRFGDADYPVDLGLDPLGLLRDPYPYFPRFRRRTRGEEQG
jgi:hypothetical protein